MNNFVIWLNEEANRLGLSYADIARRGGISKSMISRVVSEQSQPGLEFVLAMCRAFGVSADVVLGHAGLLPPVAEAAAEEREVVAILQEQPPPVRRTVVAMLRGLVRRPLPIDRATSELMAVWERTDPEDRPELVRAIRMLQLNAAAGEPRIIGEEDVEERTPAVTD